jgi:membrane-anchored protein YejM (alkaline phosphatase superfamily)
MLGPETTPALARWAGNDVRRFEDHVSGGNSTRYGIFSMLYGLYGSYWFPFLQEERGPVLIDVLAEAGYEFGVFSSATMNYPELRSTAWSRIPHAVHDAFPGEEPWQRDEQAADACVEWLASLPAEEPFFGFLLLDSPHQTYSHPPTERPFTPSADEVDYLALTRNEPDPARLQAVRNRYKNAVWHADRVAARVLAALDELGLGTNTLVLVTGDHGEEFRECGFFGHTSAYTPQQIAVPLILRGPLVRPGTEHRATSHLDIAPTLLELLGADPGLRPAWTLGENLFEPSDDRRRVISGWNELGVWAPGGILRVPLSLLAFDVEVYDYCWNLIPDDASVLAAERDALTELGLDCNRFLLKPPTR